MDHEQEGLFEAAGVAMPAYPRPAEGDPAVIRAAAETFAARIARSYPDYIKGIEEADLVEDMVRLSPGIHDDAVDMAQDLARVGYASDAAAVEALGEWSVHHSDALGKLVATWVTDTLPPPPFDTLARVEFTLRGDIVAGLGYRTAPNDRQAKCLVVPDGEMPRYTMGGALAGGRILNWEDVRVTGVATADDRGRYDAMLRQEKDRARRARSSDFERRIRKDFERAVAVARAELSTMGDEARRARVVTALASAAGEASASGSDPFSGSQAVVVAAIQMSQAAYLRSAFAREVEEGRETDALSA